MWNPINFISETQTAKVFKQRLTAVAILVAAGFVGFIALLFGLFSVFLLLSQGMSEIQASLIIFCALIAVTTVLVLIANFKKNKPQARSTTGSTLASTVFYAAPVGLRMLRKYPKAGMYTLLGTVLVSVIAGRYLKSNKDDGV